MNIFFLDRDPRLAAQYHYDKHVLKMIVETAQILCGVHHHFKNSQPWMYKPTHLNHPCSLWARRSTSNYRWLATLGLALCDEYEYRYGKVHKTRAIIELLERNFPKKLPANNLLPPAQAMPDEYMNDDAVIAYRSYYVSQKLPKAKYTRRQWPAWAIKKEIIV